MDNLKNIIRQNIDLSLPYFEMYEKFLIQWDEDTELELALKEISVDEIKVQFMKIYEDYYLPDSKIREKEATFKELKKYNQYNLVHALSNKGEHLIFNVTIGIMMSKTSMERFIKKYSIDDITRVRLYCMYYKHVRPDDDFITNLDKLNVKWKPIDLKNPKRMIARFPKISI